MDSEKNEGDIMADIPEEIKKKKNVRIELYKPDDFKQVYSIGAVGGHSPYDFRIGFYNDMPMAISKSGDEQVIQRRLETEIILSPLATVELVRWLSQHIQNYEATFGPIAKPPASIKKKKSEPVQDSTEIQGYI
ncbi:DUF3467 domain-containing protein [Methanolobus psychrotolerans]|uniref:DUF3467 domain-containing protein n=1 Tax=Methanolobus psychrotolerans TaxID=1874706 RepID=UPI001F5C6FB3|nr:DUF3467 domain-containing protein [Methanolobus psychrotolerans]